MLRIAVMNFWYDAITLKDLIDQKYYLPFTNQRMLLNYTVLRFIRNDAAVKDMFESDKLL